jgi:hypothetical protein
MPLNELSQNRSADCFADFYGQQLLLMITTSSVPRT